MSYPVIATLGSYDYIKVEKVGSKGEVGLITLDRPECRNFFDEELITEVAQAIESLDADPSVGALVLTGSEKAFSIAYTIFGMDDTSNFLEQWNTVSAARKPTIAAVNGYALGAGWELAMMCDIIYAGDKAKFGRPREITGAISGAGSIQRLARTLGKSRVMEILLSGQQFTAQEAERGGLVSKVVPAEQLVAEAVKLGEKIASHSKVHVAFAKDAINKAFATTLQTGLEYEKRLFWSTFATADQKEGMKAFAEKRAPNFKDE